MVVACDTGGGGGSATNSYAGKTIKLGADLSVTGAGILVGVQSRNGMQLAVDQINKAGGVLGAKIVLKVTDDASDPEQSAAGARTMIQQDQDLALLGPTLSSSAVMVHPIAESLKTPILAVSTAGTHVVPDCLFPQTTPCRYVFRDSLGEQAAIPDNIQSYAADAHPSTGVLFVTQDDRLSTDDGKIVQDTVGTYKIKLLKTITFSTTEAHLSSLVAQAVKLKPDVMFITSPGGIPAEIMIDARQQGWQGQFLGGSSFNTAVSAQAGTAGTGAQSASAWYLGNSLPSNAEFVAAYTTAYKRPPDQFAAQGYTAIKILADSAKRAKLTFSDLAGDREKLRTAMETVNIQTPLGPFQFTSNHDVKQTVWITRMDGQGGFTLVHQISPG
jgi:branched-chain amino acid transport system substrate-binding protein